MAILLNDLLFYALDCKVADFSISKARNSHEKFSFQSKGLHKVFQVAWWLTWKKYRARLFLQEELAILAGIQFFNPMAMI